MKKLQRLSAGSDCGIDQDGIKGLDLIELNVGDNFKVSTDGHITAVDCTLSGRLAIPFIDSGSLSNNSVINLDNKFNIVGESYLYPNVTIFLPNDVKYNGVVCHVFNKGLTKNHTSIIVKQQNGNGFIGLGTSTYLSSIEITSQRIAVFVAVLVNGRLVWACTNYKETLY